jgi:putative transposase
VTTTVVQAYRFAVDPTPTQEAVLRSPLRGAAVRGQLGPRAGDGEPGSAPRLQPPTGFPSTRGPPRWAWSAYSLRKLLEPGQRRDSAVVGENSKEAYSSGLGEPRDRACATGPRRVKGTRACPKMTSPRCRGKRVGLSCRFTTGAFGLGRGSSACAVPAYRPPCARTRVDAETRPACRGWPGTYPIGHRPRIGPGVGSARSPWRSPAPTPPLLAPGSVVGVDLGVTSPAVPSTGEITREPASSAGRPTGAAPPTAPSRQAYRPMGFTCPFWSWPCSAPSASASTPSGSPVGAFAPR